MTQTAAPAASPAGAPLPRRTRRRIWPRVLVAVAILLVVVLGAGAAYLFTIDRSVTSNLNRGLDLPSDDPTAASEAARPTKEPQEIGTLNYVLLGSDSRDPGNAGSGRSDTTMVVHLNARRNQAYIVSFPRDMYVEIPGYGRNKINAAYSSHGYDYPEGEITIAGEQALWFVRERKQLPNGDLDRAKNQRNVIKAVVSKGLSAGVVSDPGTFTRFIGGVAKHLTVDNSLSDEEIRRTALSLRLRSSDINLLQAPISGFGTTSDGQSIDVVDTAKMAELAGALKTDTMDAYVKKYPQG